MKKAIVLAADIGYLEKLEVVIKSLCYHHTDLKIYVFNDDLPSEWFQLMEQRLSKGILNSEIVNVLIDSSRVQQFRSPSNHIRYNTYFRYYIGEVVEESIALYLDCDMVVDKNLDDLFELDLSEYYVAAVNDTWNNPNNNAGFNAGMLLVNVEKWRNDRILDQLLLLTNEHHETVYGDQGVLNLLFSKEQWLPLPRKYNAEVGIELDAFYWNSSYYSESNWSKNLGPSVIHYEGPYKPWKWNTLVRYRDVWWFYYGLEWSDISIHNNSVGIKSLTKIQFHTAIYTNSSVMPFLRELLEQLPEVQFHILAKTDFSPWLYEFRKYSNVTFYPNMTPFQEREVFEKLDFYLDISRGEELGDIIKRMQESNRPIFGFNDTSHDVSGESHLYEFEQWETMVSDIKTYFRNASD